MLGETVSHYRILDKLGEGGMGAVYRAQDTRLRRLVALKFISAEQVDDAVAKRFLHEAHAASALNHPNIITIHDIGESEAGRYIAMELVQGRTLRALAGTPIELVCDIGAQAARALAAAHAAGIVHRDIKPDNIMVRDDGFVKVLDFGLARVVPSGLDQTETVSLLATAPGTLVGTLRYMSPEQARVEAVGAASDVFSLGIVLYELATGRHPFEAASQVGVLHAILSDAPLPPSRLRPEMPAALERLILRMLEKDARLRPTAAAVEAALRESPAGPVLAPVAAPPRHTVGRETEIQDLHAAFDSVLADRGLMAFVAGEAGLGKTTLIEDFLEDLAVRATPCAIARGRCSERLAGSEAYLPILEALESLLHGEARDATSRVMKLVAPTWYVQVAPLASEDSSFERAMAEARTASQERMKRELVALLQELSRSRPLLLFLDDVHWADVSTVDMLAYLGARLESMPLLVIAAYRPSDLLLAKHALVPVKLELQARGLAREIAVAFLTRDDVAAYLALEFPEHCFPADLPDRLHRRTEGNALFMADLVRYLKGRGVIAQQDGRWVLARAMDEIERELPESVRSMIEKKINQMDAGGRRLLAAASVQGQQFDSAVVAKALGVGQADLEERLEVLDRLHGLVRLEGDHELPDSTLTLRYGFVHALYQNAFYGSLTATRKAALSAAVAEALLGFYGERASEAASDLALLFEAARDFGRASHYFLAAAGNARRIYASREALDLAERALRNAEKLRGTARHAGVAAAAMVLGEVHTSGAQPDAAIASYTLAEQAARDGDDQETRILAIVGQANILALLRRLADSEEQASRAMDAGRQVGSDVGIALAEARLAGIRVVQGRLSEADSSYRRAFPVLREHATSQTALQVFGSALWMREQRLEHEEFEELAKWMQPAASEVGGAFVLFALRYIGALVLANQGHLSQALSALIEVRRLADLNGDRVFLPRVPNALGWLYRELLDIEGALKWDAEGVRLAHEMNCDEAEANSHVNLGHDYLAAGEPARAWEHLEEASKIFDRDIWNRWRYNIRLQAERSSYWITSGDLQRATAHAAACLESSKATLSRKHWAWAHKLLGDIALLEDRPTDARSNYGQALTILERHACPVIEWRILAAAADAARRLHDSAADDFQARARHVIRRLAESITDPPLRERFLASKQVRDL